MSERSQLLLFAVAGLLTGYLIGQGWYAGDVETARLESRDHIARTVKWEDDRRSMLKDILP